MQDQRLKAIKLKVRTFKGPGAKKREVPLIHPAVMLGMGGT
jgi:hypothetical protein